MHRILIAAALGLAALLAQAQSPFASMMELRMRDLLAIDTVRAPPKREEGLEFGT